jgi:hypothetical protein
MSSRNFWNTSRDLCSVSLPKEIARLALDWNPQSSRRRGRPKVARRRTVLEEAKIIGKSWNEIKHTAKNRVRRKNLVETICSEMEWWYYIYKPVLRQGLGRARPSRIEGGEVRIVTVDKIKDCDERCKHAHPDRDSSTDYHQVLRQLCLLHFSRLTSAYLYFKTENIQNATPPQMLHLAPTL